MKLQAAYTVYTQNTIQTKAGTGRPNFVPVPALRNPSQDTLGIVILPRDDEPPLFRRHRRPPFPLHHLLS